MDKAKILFVSQEIMPYLPETQISHISRRLPQGILEKGKEIRTFMPRYGNVNERRNQLHEVIRLSGLNLNIDDTDHPLIIKVASIQSARMQIYFIDNDDYFQRKTLFTEPDGSYCADNDERAIFFARGVLETTRKLRWAPSIIHCHGWFTSFVPFFARYLFADDPHFATSKIVISLYPDAFDNRWDNRLRDKLKVENLADNAFDNLNVTDYQSLMRMAIDLSDGVCIGSPEADGELIEYARSKGKPILDYHNEETYIAATNEFYDQLLQ